MFLPINREDMQKKDWHYLDFVIISGDAYVDHPSFAPALIGRWLESLGYRVGIIPQPNWQKADSFKVLGRPRYAFLICPGNLDSMLNHYTANKKKRHNDAYSPGGKIGLRPDRATLVYTKLAKEAFFDVPVIIGGIENSLRRFAHYDFWADEIWPSYLVKSGADLLLFGMGELPLRDVAAILAGGKGLSGCHEVPGVCYISQVLPKDCVELPSFTKCVSSKRTYALAFALAEAQQNHYSGKKVVQKYAEGWLVQNPPARPLSTEEMDAVYALPFNRRWHPVYDRAGGVPALAEVKFSLLSHRGCFGGCSFCAISAHQGRVIQNRSDEAILAEAAKLAEDPDFKGYIHDVGGPTANFRLQGCGRAKEVGACANKQCLWPEPCKQLKVDHGPYARLLAEIGRIPNIKKVFVRSGLRYDYCLLEPNDKFLRQLCRDHISGQLKVAPEHVAPEVLRYMGKPKAGGYKRFVEQYEKINKDLGKKQYLVPYFMAGHPGTRLKDAVALAEYFRDEKWLPEQVQDFIPTPGSLSTAMFYTGLNPRTMQPVYVPRGKERLLQHVLLQYTSKENWPLVRQALKEAGREDLIGRGPKCLVPAESGSQAILSAGRKGGSDSKVVGGKNPRERKAVGSKKKDKDKKGYRK